MILYVKFMVSMRCKLLVKDELKRMGLHYVFVDLGVIEILETITPEQYEELETRLKLSGLELMDDKRSIIIEKIKGVLLK